MEEKTKKTTVRIPESTHKKLMKHLIDIDKSFQQYIMELIEEDLFYNDNVSGQTNLKEFLDEIDN